MVVVYIRKPVVLAVFIETLSTLGHKDARFEVHSHVYDVNLIFEIGFQGSTAAVSSTNRNGTSVTDRTKASYSYE